MSLVSALSKIFVNKTKNKIDFLESLVANYISGDQSHQESDINPVFVVGSGRCGTHFFAKLMRHSNKIVSLHLDDIDSLIHDSFIQYSAWNNLKVDFDEFKNFRQYLMNSLINDNNKIYIESNPYLSLIIERLHKWFKAKIIFLVRDPKNVVNSHYAKGWYNETLKKSRENCSPFIRYNRSPHYTFGRIIPNGNKYNEWKKMTRIGKISWYVNTVNKEIYNKLRYIDTSYYSIIKIDEFDYDKYTELIKNFIGINDFCNLETFNKIKNSKPGKGKKKHKKFNWNDKENNEFYSETKWLRKKMLINI